MKAIELKKKYEEATYDLRDKIECGLCCSTCMYASSPDDCVEAEEEGIIPNVFTTFCTMCKKVDIDE